MRQNTGLFAVFMPQGKLTSLPEENVPEEQPAGVEAQSQQWEEQGAIGVVVQHALCQRRQEELPALSQRQRRLLQLPPQEQAAQECGCWARQHQQSSIERPGRRSGVRWALSWGHRHQVGWEGICEGESGVRGTGPARTGGRGAQ